MIIVFKNTDGGCGIVVPAPKALKKMSLDEIAKKSVPKGSAYDIVDDGIFPKDRTFRNAWTFDSKTVGVDMAKAQNIQMDRIRGKRDKKLKELDIETMKGNDVQAKKQVLRDIPQTFDLKKYKTPEELKEVWPDFLRKGLSQK